MVQAVAGRVDDVAREQGAQQLRDLGVTEEALEACVAAVLERGPDLEGTPPAASEAEIRSLYEAAF